MFPSFCQVLLHRNGSWLKSAQEAKFLPCNQDHFGGNSPHLSSYSTSKSILQPARLNFTDCGKPDVALRHDECGQIEKLLDKSSRSLKSLQLHLCESFISVDSVGVGGELKLSCKFISNRNYYTNLYRIWITVQLTCV